jgi:hypothetical protein
MVLSIVGTCVWTDRALQHYEQIAREEGQRREIAEARFAEAKTTVVTDTVRVTRWATKYDTIRDTVDAMLSTDTVQTVPAYWVRGLIVASDSTIHACRELVRSSGRALTACDSVQIALGREKDAWKNAYEQAKPSRFQKALPWIAGAAGLWAGAKLRVR